MKINYIPFYHIRDINNLIHMCDENIRGVKCLVDGVLKEHPWEDWINGTIEGAISIIDDNTLRYDDNIRKYYKYISIISDRTATFNDDTSNEQIKEFLIDIQKLDSKTRCINLINYLECVKYNQEHYNEYINKHTKKKVKLIEFIDVYINGKKNKHKCVKIQTDKTIYAIEASFFKKQYIPNKKEFDFKITDKLYHKPSVTSFDFGDLDIMKDVIY